MKIRFIFAMTIILISFPGFEKEAVAASYLAPLLKIVDQPYDENYFILDVEVSHPGIRNLFSGLAAEIHCKDQDRSESFLILIGLKEDHAFNKMRLIGFSLTGEVFWPKKLEPGETQSIRITWLRNAEQKAFTCNRIAVRGAW